ncbi:hypothetical protein [Shouchella patagoniensis]|uniref:hypothetical protein n=1 Tax=Shouchella patagoniensis TaxID=228576 RepID=UPI00099518E2|nr:hypothetical protein [Shouchella patagoniensis]
MELIIKSPLKPLLFKQSIHVQGEVSGYLAAKNPLKIAIGRHSYKSTYRNATISLEEQKTQNKKRNWIIRVSNETAGVMVMSSGTSDTLKHNLTSYHVTFKDKNYHVNKPFMQLGAEESFLYDEQGVLLAQISSSYSKKPRFKKIIKIHNGKEFIEEEIAFFIVTLNTTLFVS